jgi:hypothetical protein
MRCGIAVLIAAAVDAADMSDRKEATGNSSPKASLWPVRLPISDSRSDSRAASPGAAHMRGAI